MAKSNFESVNEYIAAQPEPTRSVLESVRSAIRRAVPKAEEMISYKIPAYKRGRVPFVYFAAWKQHYSLYPATAGVLAEFKDDLAKYEVDKHTIRLAWSARVPVGLIRRIAKFRAQEMAAKAKSKG